MSDVFEKRLRRISQLQNEWPFADEVLSFFRVLTAAQKELYDRLAEKKPDDFSPSWFLETGWVQAFMERIDGSGPDELREMIQGWRSVDRGDWHSLITFGWQAMCSGPPDHDHRDEETYPFFVKLVLQPYAAWLYPPPKPRKLPHQWSGECPSCVRLPQVSLLREDKQAETVRRTLVCSFCPTEWDLARVLCPACGEEKPEKLPRYSAQEIPWMRVEACDSCKKYIKSVDLTQNWDAEPIVDELASTPLDVIAHEHGYTKIAPNLAGI